MDPRVKNHNRYMKFRAEAKARRLVQQAILSGDITKSACEVCGSKVRIEAHHDDYNKPLEIRWLCASCHKKWHTQNKPIRAAYTARKIHCAKCGKKFTPKERHTMYCSDGCRLEARREANRRSLKKNGYKYTKRYKMLISGEKKICAYCGEEYVESAKKGWTKYCSNNCRHLARLDQKKRYYWDKKQM